MSICLCYHDEQNFLHERGVCYGTKEKEPCSCGGNPVKCDFYEEVREAYIHRSNADHIRAMTDEELSEWLTEYGVCEELPMFCEDKKGNCHVCWLDWLKQEANYND